MAQQLSPQERVDQMCAMFREQAESLVMEKEQEAATIADQYFDQQISNTTKTLEGEAMRQESEIEKNLQIQNAKIKNSAKLEILKAQQTAINEALKETVKRLNEFSKGPEYPDLLAKLIAEGLIQLNEPKVRLMVRKADIEICEKVLPKALEMTKAKVPGLEPKIIIEKERFLDPEPRCAGGVAFICHKGKIRLSNTLNDRLRLAYDGVLPQIRKIVFTE